MLASPVTRQHWMSHFSFYVVVPGINANKNLKIVMLIQNRVGRDVACSFVATYERTLYDDIQPPYEVYRPT